MSSRGETAFVSTWGSRGSALANKVAFQHIATAKQKQLCFAMTYNFHIANNDCEYLFIFCCKPHCTLLYQPPTVTLQ